MEQLYFLATLSKTFKGLSKEEASKVEISFSFSDEWNYFAANYAQKNSTRKDDKNYQVRECRNRLNKIPRPFCGVFLLKRLCNRHVNTSRTWQGHLIAIELAKRGH